MSTTLALQLFQLMRTGSAVLTGVILAKSGLPVSEIGAWEMLLYLGTTLTFFWVNGLLQGFPPLFSQYSREEQRALVFNQFLLFSGIAFALFLLMLSLEPWLVPALTGLPSLPLFKWYALYLLFNLPSYPVEYLYMLQGQARSIVWWGIASFGLHLAALGLPLASGMGLGTGIQLLVGLSALKLAWAVLLVRKYGAPKWSPALLKRYVAFCVPLMLGTVVSNCMYLFDNWLVGWHFGDPSVFAVYRYGAREFPLALALLSALGASLVPVLVNDPAEGLASLKSKVRRLMHLVFPVTILLLFASKWLFPIVFSTSFVESASLFNIYLLTLSSRVMLPASIALAKSDSRGIFQVSVAELAAKIALGFLFIRLWGLEGLAWSVVLSFWVEKIGLVWLLETRHGVRTSDWLDLRWYAFYVALLMLAYSVAAAFF
jgi:O-antigen/teichoic acid export membrane protein